jgi:hypothetical protein
VVVYALRWLMRDARCHVLLLPLLLPILPPLLLSLLKHAQLMEQRQADQLDGQLGWPLFTEGDDRLGWLLNFHTVRMRRCLLQTHIVFCGGTGGGGLHVMKHVQACIWHVTASGDHYQGQTTAAVWHAHLPSHTHTHTHKTGGMQFSPCAQFRRVTVRAPTLRHTPHPCLC